MFHIHRSTYFARMRSVYGCMQTSKANFVYMYSAHALLQQHQLNRSEEITIFKVSNDWNHNECAPMSTHDEHHHRRRPRCRIVDTAAAQQPRPPLHPHYPSTRSLRPPGKLKKSEHAIKLLDAISEHF